MIKNLPLGTIAIALLAPVIALMYVAAARTHPTDPWLIPIALAFIAVGLLALAVTLKLREYGTRLSELERQIMTLGGI